MPAFQPSVAYLTSGAASMYCGSCLHDNTLARALTNLDIDIQLIPTYTPIRTDEDDASVDRVFFGGVNVYLQQKVFLFRYLPALLDRFLDAPWLLRKVTSKTSSISASQLGSLTVSMLKGRKGNQRKEVKRLGRWLERQIRPDMVVLSNMLIGGCLPELRRRLGVPLVVTLQGDDIFLDELTEPFRTQAITLMRQLVSEVDGFLVNSRFYAERMQQLLEIPDEKIHLVPLGLDTDDFGELPARDDRGGGKLTVGYLARLAPEKGLHLLVDAFIALKQRPRMDHVQLRIAGWLGDHRRDYADEQFDKLRAAGLESAFQYDGAVDREGKIEFLKAVDVVSVPTVYEEPKGLFVLESLAAGVPVVQPAHGAFPEVLDRLGGGVLVEPRDSEALGRGLAELLEDGDRRLALGQSGRQAVLQHAHAAAMAEQTLDALQEISQSTRG